MLHLVFGGELTSLDKIEFSDLKALDIVGIYPNYAQAYDAWKDAATAPSTTRICATSSCICTGCSTPRRTRAARPGHSGIQPNGFFALEARAAAC